MIKQPSSADTVEFISTPAPRDPAGSLSGSKGPHVDVAGRSHPGKVRKHNEDHFLVCRYGRFLQALASNLPLDDDPGYVEDNGYAMVVADGMGGHVAGEVASRLAISSLVQLALSMPDWVLRFDDEKMSAKTMNRARQLVDDIKDILIQLSAHDPSLRGYGTTLALAWSVGRDFFVLHIGDSRVYLSRQGVLQQLTRDHTISQALADTGMISQAQVAGHFLRHHLSQCLNDSAMKIQPDVQHLKLEDGDRILICSDGLTEMVEGSVLGVILERSSSAQDACAELIQRALDGGGKDNVTAIVAKYRFCDTE